MPADFNQPTIGTGYPTFLSTLLERDVDSLTLCVSDPSNIPTGAIKYDRANNRFQEWNGTTWVTKILSLSAGGTGGNSAGTARTSLGLGDLATQNSSSVNITGGTITGVSADASILTSGLIDQSRLGSGSGGAGLKFLADDQTWKDAEAVGIGKIWFKATPPSGYLICDGSLISRSTYANLFAVIGTTAGAGDGSTTFALPDFRGRIPFGLAASGTGSTLLGTFGSIDHTHTGPAHTHDYTQVPNHTHVITDAGHLHAYSRSTNNGDQGVVVSGGTRDFITGTTTVNTSTGFAAATCANPTGGVTTGTTDSGGTGDSGTSNPPCLVVNFIIKY